MSLIEIMVSTVILAVVLAGLMNLFVLGKRYVLHDRSKSTSSVLGRRFLDDFAQRHVRQDTWGLDVNCLTNMGSVSCPNTVTRGVAEGLDKDYTATYVVSQVDLSDASSPYRVQVTLSWVEQ